MSVLDETGGALAEELARVRPELSGVNGVRESAEAFVGHWQRSRPAITTPGISARIYQLEQFVPPASDVPGGLRTAGVAPVGPVYTPPEHRRRGYASAGVAAVSRLALDGGADHCMLSTDLANPTSNSIYQALGYRPAFDAPEYVVSHDRDG